MLLMSAKADALRGHDVSHNLRCAFPQESPIFTTNNSCLLVIYFAKEYKAKISYLAVISNTFAPHSFLEAEL